jgi:NADH-quinone oxidoreductase subunit J
MRATALVETPVAGRGDAAAISSVRALGGVLFTDYMFAFEATSILILVAMVGAVVLARREDDR